ncbi:hypothetical protein E2562_034926 [Oryza meyeriana var. granulata]|uniref:BRO1 domain-containing protein n=1 Tax=Oryza meyeriana var. granulata TaxID=110450 RepID=A0A6G1F1H7_9ORYZ|nr:hypothetical protein E2562_034926 [Oryza meyeriana var. granulata]
MKSLFRRAASAAAPAPMPMLSFQGKRPKHFTVDTSAAERNVELEAFMRARRLVVLSSERDGGGEAVAADLRAYIREIEVVAGPRFEAAVRRVEPSSSQLEFVWQDAVAGGRHRWTTAAEGCQCHTSLETERAMALVALSAELARGAAAEDRRGVDGIRRACAALCDAAGALREAAAGRAPGVSPTHLTALEGLMLAQALECYFELAVAGGRPPALCSMVARQVSLDYGQVGAALESPELRQHADHRSWAAHAEAKAAYFAAEACLRAARARRAAGDVGVAIARLRQALASLKGLRPLKKAAAPVQDAAKWLNREVEAELAGAEQDNCRIYCMASPAVGTLAELQQQLVRPTPLENILQQGTHGGGGGAPAAGG